MPRSELSLFGAWYSARALTAAEWTPAIFFALRNGPLHYKDILASIRETNLAEQWSPRPKHLHESVLVRSLQRLVAEGLVVRRGEPGAFPPSVQYELSAPGRELLAFLAPIATWSERHNAVIAKAQAFRQNDPKAMES